MQVIKHDLDQIYGGHAENPNQPDFNIYHYVYDPVSNEVTTELYGGGLSHNPINLQY